MILALPSIAQKGKNINQHKSFSKRSTQISAGAGFSKPTGGNVGISSGTAVNLSIYKPLVVKCWEDKPTSELLAQSKCPNPNWNPKNYIDFGFVFGLNYVLGKQFIPSTGNSTIMKYPLLNINGQTASPLYKIDGTGRDKVLLWQLGLQSNCHIGKIIISPILKVGYMSAESKAISISQITEFNDTSKSLNLYNRGGFKTSGFAVTPELKLTYMFGNIGFHLGAAYTLGPSANTVSTTFIPNGNTDIKGMYSLEQIYNGSTKTNEILIKNSSINAYAGITFDFGRPKLRGCGKVPNCDARIIDKDGKSCTDKRPLKKSKETLNTDLITWDNADLPGKLGYKFITFRRRPKGKYIIIRDKKHPFGFVTIDIENAEKLNGEEITIIKEFKTNCVSKGGKNCNQDGFGCLVYLDNPQMSVEPVYDENHILKKLKLIMLTAEAAKSWEDPNHFNEELNIKYQNDSAGIKHNLLVDDFMKSEQFQELINNKDPEYQFRIPNPLQDRFNKFCIRFPWFCDRGNGPYNPFGSERLLKGIVNNENTSDIIKQSYLDAGLSKSGINIANDILEIRRKPNLNTFKSKLNTLAITILSQEEMDQLEKERLLAMISTAKNSLAYWNEFRKKPTYSEIVSKKIDYDEAGVWDTIGALFGPEGAAGASIGNIIGQIIMEK